MTSRRDGNYLSNEACCNRGTALKTTKSHILPQHSMKFGSSYTAKIAPVFTHPM